MYDLFSGKVKFVEGWPALLIGKTLIIADVHIGIEKELWKEGVRVSNLSDWAVNSFKQLLEVTKPKKIIINGDLRHNIPIFTKNEAKKVVEFVQTGETYGNVLVVKGNHDGDLEKIIDNVVGTVTRVKGIYIAHGHTRLDKRPVIIGHVHPAYPINLHFRKEYVKVWLVNDDTVVLPAFSPYIIGNDVTSPENWLGPIARNQKEFSAFTLDGFYVDRIHKELNVYPPPQAGAHRTG